METTDIHQIARRHDNQAFEALMSRFRPWVRVVAARWAGLPGIDPQDLEQAAWVGLVEATIAFEPERSSFSVWARGVMRRRMLDAVKAANRRKHEPLAHAASLWNDEGEEQTRWSTQARTPLDQVIDHETIREQRAQLVAMLTPMEQRVLECLLRGIGPQEGSRELGISYIPFGRCPRRAGFSQNFGRCS